MRNRSDNQVTFVLIRHGETKANAERRYLGKTDEPLSEEGRKKLAFYKKQGYYPEVEYLFCSPMKRCLETAEILYPNLAPKLIMEWAEMDFGRFEYKNYEELRYDAQYRAWMDSGGMMPFPEGESREVFGARCEKGFSRMWDALQQAEDERPVGMIVHGGTIMALLSRFGGGDYFDYQCANGAGYLCRGGEESGNMRMVIVRELAGMRGGST